MISQVVILSIGMATLVVYTSLISVGFFKARHQLAKSEKERAQETLDESRAVQQQLVIDLTTSDRSTQTCIDRFESARSNLMPGIGPLWTKDDLLKRRNVTVDERLSPLRSNAFRRLVIGPVLIAGVTFIAWVIAYGQYSTSQPSRVDSVFDAGWSTPPTSSNSVSPTN